MPGAITNFIRDTSVYTVSGSLPPITHPTPSREISLLQIAQAMKKISSQLLELDERKVVTITLTGDTCLLQLGKIGNYSFADTPENLCAIGQRLDTLALSSRFINALLGHWPA